MCDLWMQIKDMGPEQHKYRDCYIQYKWKGWHYYEGMDK